MKVSFKVITDYPPTGMGDLRGHGQAHPLATAEASTTCRWAERGVKHWMETRQVYSRIGELMDDGKGAALATVVRVRGSAYRHEGAKLVVAEDGSSVGNVSGGCLGAGRA